MVERKWMKDMKAIGDNPAWGFGLISAMRNELENRDRPDPGYLREKLKRMENFVKDLELADEKASKRKKLCKVM